MHSIDSEILIDMLFKTSTQEIMVNHPVHMHLHFASSVNACKLQQFISRFHYLSIISIQLIYSDKLTAQEYLKKNSIC